MFSPLILKIKVTFFIVNYVYIHIKITSLRHLFCEIFWFKWIYTISSKFKGSRSHFVFYGLLFGSVYQNKLLKTNSWWYSPNISMVDYVVVCIKFLAHIFFCRGANGPLFCSTFLFYWRPKAIAIGPFLVWFFHLFGTKGYTLRHGQIPVSSCLGSKGRCHGFTSGPEFPSVSAPN